MHAVTVDSINDTILAHHASQTMFRMDDPPRVLELVHRVRIIPSMRMPLYAPRITIFTRDGRSYSR